MRMASFHEGSIVFIAMMDSFEGEADIGVNLFFGSFHVTYPSGNDDPRIRAKLVG